jgi:hypothetical protein
MDLFYSQKGANFGSVISGGGNLLSDDFNLVLNYLDIPLLLKYNYIHIGGMSFQGGIKYSILLGGAIDGVKIQKDNFKSSDISAVLGYGYDGKWFHYSLRYNLGLASIYSNSSKGKNEMLTLSIGYWIKK